MNISLCTISFRHQLISLSEIANFARSNGFDGIELWGAHARNLSGQWDKDADWLSGYGLVVPMISDYLPLDGDQEALRSKTIEVCNLARRWGATKIRTFAGSRASNVVSADDRRRLTGELRRVATIVADFGIELLVETHPETLADNAASTVQLLAEVAHPAVGINFDILHVWEAGDDPVALHDKICSRIKHYHLKNITERRHLSVFAPANVYAAAGSRTGMTSLFTGAVDYQHIISAIPAVLNSDVSLEWFGNDCFRTLAHDHQLLRDIGQFSEAHVAASR